MADEDNKRDEKTGHFLAGNKYGRSRKGARNKLHADFITALLDHFHMTTKAQEAETLPRGAAAIEIVYREDPRAYLKLIASVLPKELIHEDGRLEAMSDEEIAEYLDYIRRFKTQIEGTGEGRSSIGGGTNPALN